MVDIEYANAYSEVLEILKYISNEDYIKIPKKCIRVFEENSNINHQISYNPEQTLDEQNISKRAKAIIAILYRDYWATSSQREKIVAKQNYDRKKLEEQKRKLYNPDNIFKNKEKAEKVASIKENSAQLIEYKEENFFIKILNKIKRFLKHRNYRF